MKALAAAFVLCSSSLLAQDFVVTTKRDTLRGRISISSYPTMDRVIVTGQDKKKMEYPSPALLSVTIDGIVYQPVRIPDSYRLMKVGRTGQVLVCYSRQAPGTPYDIPYLVKRTGESMQVTTLRFRKNIISFLNECANLGESIEKEDLGKQDLDKIIDLYNHCIDRQTSQIMETTEDPTLKAISNLSKRFNEDPTAPKDAVDILKDITLKVKEGKVVPNYLSEGLKSALSGRGEYTDDVEALLKLLKK